MTHSQKIIELFHCNHNRLTLGELLRHPSGCGYEARARFTELRHKGYVIELIEKHPEAPSLNVYALLAEPGESQLGLAV